MRGHNRASGCQRSRRSGLSGPHRRIFQSHRLPNMAFRRLYAAYAFIPGCLETAFFNFRRNLRRIFRQRFTGGHSEHPESLVLVDPVMGDHGRTYSTVTQRHCERIRDLVKKADMITPNVTEACLLTDTAYKESGWSLSELHDLAGKLQKLGPKKAVITGIAGDNCLINYYYETASSDAAGIRTGICESPFAGPNHHGTGDIFASVLAADALNGVPFSASVQKASDFVRMCIAGTCALGLPEEEGVCFENYLGELIRLGHNNGGNNIGQQTCAKACNTEYNPD